MLENEPTGSGSGLEPTPAPGEQTATPSSSTANPRRRRAASRPAGKPAAEAVASAPAEPPPPPEPAASADPGPDTSAPDSSAAVADPPVKKARAPRKAAAKTTASRTRTKLTALPAPIEPVEDAPAVPAAEIVPPPAPEPEPVAAADTVPEPEAPATRRRTRKRAVAPQSTPEPADRADQDQVQIPVLIEATFDLDVLDVDPASAQAEPDEEEPQEQAPTEVVAPVRPGMLIFQAPVVVEPVRRRRATAPQSAPASADIAAPDVQDAPEQSAPVSVPSAPAEQTSSRRRRRGKVEAVAASAPDQAEQNAPVGPAGPDSSDQQADISDDGDSDGSNRRRRRRRRRQTAEDLVDLGATVGDDPPNTVVKIREPRDRRSGRSERNNEPDSVRTGDDVLGVRGSVRLAAKQQRRRDGRSSRSRRTPIVTEAEFLARRESVERIMVVRESAGRTQIGVLEDGVLVEHYVNRESSVSYVGNVYLGKVQNVLPSMEAAFVDISKGRNAVLYAGEVNFEAAGISAGAPKRIESALKSGQPVLVQVTKDPIGHKGARLTSQISLPGRFLVYIPGGSMMGISRKLPENERTRLKQILKKVVPEDGGVIVRTAAEGASEEELAQDVERLVAQWDEIERRSHTVTAPALLHGEPDLSVRVIRDIFNEDFTKLIISGGEAYKEIHEYLAGVAPELAERVEHWTSDTDVFSVFRVDEQLAKGLDRKVWLPSGGSLVIDRTEAMIVIDVNTGKFTGQGSNSLEETVTRNNLEAAEEIVRQLRLRDLGGIVVIDFIDMVLESNRELVLRRLLECLGRDRTKHQVAEVTSLGLVQMTRKRVGQGLLEAFSETCEHCNGRGVIVHMEPVEAQGRKTAARQGGTVAESAVESVIPAVKPLTSTDQEPGWRQDGPSDAAESRANRRRRRKGKHHDGDGFAAGGDGDDVSGDVTEAPDEFPGPAAAVETAQPRSRSYTVDAAPEAALAEVGAPIILKAHEDDPDALGGEAELSAALTDTGRPRKRRRAASRPAGSPAAESQPEN
jgi:ribonuclease E